jgi:hypothetical protein
MEDRNQILCEQTKDVAEGVAAFLEKRAPVYSDRCSSSPDSRINAGKGRSVTSLTVLGRTPA